MDETSNDAFKDLLSAALSESGIEEDFNYTATSVNQSEPQIRVITSSQLNNVQQSAGARIISRPVVIGSQSVKVNAAVNQPRLIQQAGLVPSPKVRVPLQRAATPIRVVPSQPRVRLVQNATPISMAGGVVKTTAGNIIMVGNKQYATAATPKVIQSIPASPRVIQAGAAPVPMSRVLPKTPTSRFVTRVIQTPPSGQVVRLTSTPTSRLGTSPQPIGQSPAPLVATRTPTNRIIRTAQRMTPLQQQQQQLIVQNGQIRQNSPAVYRNSPVATAARPIKVVAAANGIRTVPVGQNIVMNANGQTVRNIIQPGVQHQRVIGPDGVTRIIQTPTRLVNGTNVQATATPKYLQQTSSGQYARMTTSPNLIRIQQNAQLHQAKNAQNFVTVKGENGQLIRYMIPQTGGIAGANGAQQRVMLKSQSAANLSVFHQSPKMMANNRIVLNNHQFMNNNDKTRLWNDQFTNKLPDGDYEEEQELGHMETYSNYMPAKLNIGQPHPDPVVETSSMSSVEPNDVTYELTIPESTVDYGYLSALQLETIVYTCQTHNTRLPSGERAGFLIGDGAGVGKGRTIAGIIYENYLLGRKRSLWLSVSNDLRVDAERDLKDIGASKIEVYPLNKFKYAKITSHENNSVKKGVIFATYSSLIGESHNDGKYKTRFKQLLHWFGKDFDGLIVFDECHKAKNLCPVGSSKPTKTGSTVLELQRRLPNARIVYASATGASEPKNMAYMTRIGLWGKGSPFPEFNNFIQAVEKRGVGAMELVAMDMKLRGMYIARQLSFHGVTFRVAEIAISDRYKQIYNDSVKLWVKARESFQMGADLLDAESRMKKGMWCQFWSAHQRFFKYLCISAKVPHCVKLARDAVRAGKCVVIGLQSTGEARTLEQLEDNGGELTEFVSTARGVFYSLVDKHFPAPDRQKTQDLFYSTLFEDKPTKRKQPMSRGRSKKARFNFSENSSSDSEDEDKRSESPQLMSSSESESSSSDDDDAMSDDGNFNPFGSDDDDDPWLKKSKILEEKKIKKKLLKEKEKEKQQREKSKSDKKSKKSKKKQCLDSDDSDDLGSDIDSRFDQALTAAGLKTKQRNDDETCDVEKSIEMKNELLRLINKLGESLPANTIDELIDSLGGTEYVAEMTGRKGRVVSTDDGTIKYESRSEVDAPLEILNLTEKQRFMDGEKYIAIISEAASSGISLQADRRVINQKRRVHLTLELPWSADRAIQQFGRTHRSNQVSGPEYIFMISELAGERRFASTVSKRLESLGALTHGDRRATETRDLSRFNIDNKYGRTALESTMKSLVGIEKPMVSPPSDYDGHFFDDAKKALVGVGMFSEEVKGYFLLEKDYNSISKFLNRLLGIEVALQNALFKFFMDTMTEVILQAKRNGHWDMGILDLGSGEESVHCVAKRTFKGTAIGYKSKCELYTVSVERGMTWNKAMDIWGKHGEADEGFYKTTQARNGKFSSILLVLSPTSTKKNRLFTIYKPNTGHSAKLETLDDICKKFYKVLPDAAEHHWNEQFTHCSTACIHSYWNRECRSTVTPNFKCEVGRRTRIYFILSGSVLSVWSSVESVLSQLPGQQSTRMQIIRIQLDDGKRIIGSLIPVIGVEALVKKLTETSDSQSNIETPRDLNNTKQPPKSNVNSKYKLSSSYANPHAHLNNTGGKASGATDEVKKEVVEEESKAHDLAAHYALKPIKKEKKISPPVTTASSPSSQQASEDSTITATVKEEKPEQPTEPVEPKVEVKPEPKLSMPMFL